MLFLLVLLIGLLIGLIFGAIGMVVKVILDKPQTSPIVQYCTGDYWCTLHDCSAYECECAWI